MRLCLFEERAELLEPLSLTRPVFELRCGLTTLADKQLRKFPHAERGALVRPPLAELWSHDGKTPHVNDLDWLGAGPALLVNGRWLPPQAAVSVPPAPCVGLVQDQVAYLSLTPAELSGLTPDNLLARLDEWRQALPAAEAGGVLVNYPWDLVEHNALEIVRDFVNLGYARRQTAVTGVALVGPAERLWVARSARVDPMVVADTTNGPVVIDEGAVVQAFTRLEGPCHVGPRSQVFGGKLRAGTSLGPQCRVGGEVECSILHGHANKYHEGFLGHSYVGEWVNLGAGTHNSDLRNDYGEVSVVVGGESVRTGLNKVGCFLGDHTKTGLGTLLNTGTSVGAFCNLLPAGRFAPKYVPSFASWWNGALREVFTPEQLLDTARHAMKRRGVELTDAHRHFYACLHQATAADRRRALRESEQRQLRRSA